MDEISRLIKFDPQTWANLQLNKPVTEAISGRQYEDNCSVNLVWAGQGSSCKLRLTNGGQRLRCRKFGEFQLPSTASVTLVLFLKDWDKVPNRNVFLRWSFVRSLGLDAASVKISYKSNLNGKGGEARLKGPTHPDWKHGIDVNIEDMRDVFIIKATGVLLAPSYVVGRVVPAAHGDALGK